VELVSLVIKNGGLRCGSGTVSRRNYWEWNWSA